MPSRPQLNYIAPVLLVAAVLCVYWVKSPKILTSPRAATKAEAAKDAFVPKPLSASIGHPSQTKSSQSLSVESKAAGHIQRSSKDSSAVLAKPRLPQRAGESRVALHVHFNSQQYWQGIFWFLKETELCHPRNFMFCAFVSSWSRLGRKPGLPSHSRFGVPVALVDCPENGFREPGRFMYRCFAQTLEMAAERGAAGMLVIADDVVLLKPWREVMPLFLANETAVLPFRGGGCDVRSERYCDYWLPWERKGLIRALESLPTADRALLNVTPGPVVIGKALGDAAYLPSSFAKGFRRAAEHFYRHGVFVEWCIVPIAQLAGGVTGLPGMGGLPIWDKARENATQVAWDEVKRGRLAFFHPVKLSLFPKSLGELHKAAFGR